MGSRMGMGIGGISGGVGNKNLGCLSNRASCSSNSQCCSGNCQSFETKRYWTINACAPLKSSGTNGISNQNGVSGTQKTGHIRGGWNQEGLYANQGCNKHGPCSQDSECCSGFVCTPNGYGGLKTCVMGRKHKSNSYAFGTSRDQEGLYAQPRNLGCLGRENFCIAGISQCCPGLKCRQTNPMLPFSRCQPREDRNRNKGYIMFLDTSVFLKYIELKNNDQFSNIHYWVLIRMNKRECITFYFLQTIFRHLISYSFQNSLLFKIWLKYKL